MGNRGWKKGGRGLVGLGLGILLSATVQAVEPWHLQRHWLDESGWLVSQPPLFAAMLLTDSEQTVLANWAAPQEPVLAPVIERIAIGQPLAVMFVLGGCVADGQGHCDVRGRLLLTRPDDSVYVDPPPFPIWQGPAPAGPEIVQLGQGTLRLTFAPDDPLGEYHLAAELWDANGSAKLVLRRDFQLTSATQAEQTPTQQVQSPPVQTKQAPTEPVAGQ